VWFLDHLWLLPAIPFASWWLILFFGKRLPGRGAELGVTALVATWVLALADCAAWIARPTVGEGDHAVRHAVEHTYTWFTNGPVKLSFGFHADGLAVVMAFLVATVSLAVHIYSTEYMRGDQRFTFYYAGLSLFTWGMLTLVTAASTVQALFGWEAMGLCSFMLIGHWWEEQVNSDAALKAFYTTRMGDAGLFVGVGLLFFAAHQSFNIASLNAQALSGSIDHTLVLWGAVALFGGVIGKSAQFPLHTWLPDAMQGPTPISALIHAATMVVAGVYLAARCYGVFWAAFSINPHLPHQAGLNLVAIIGAITIVIAAGLAFVQDDIKRVLAYSTVSQLGYMVMALGVGAWTGGIFHLFTHSFFKACLFLAAGSVSHSGSHHSFDMRKDMGGLREPMPITYATFVISAVALAGIFPLAGFWSKDQILVTAGKNGYVAFMVIGLVGAFMTAAYMTRCVYLTFFGQYRGHGEPHESPPAITGPLVVLASLSATVGFLNAEPFGIHAFGQWTRNEVFVAAGVPEVKFSAGAAVLSVSIALVGAALAGVYFARYRELRIAGLTRRNHLARRGLGFLTNKYYLDDLYTGVIVGAVKSPVARGVYWFDQVVIDGVVNGVARQARRAARLVYDVIDQRVVDGAANALGVGAQGGGQGLRVLQSGRVQQYAAILFGAAGLLALVVVLLT